MKEEFSTLEIKAYKSKYLATAEALKLYLGQPSNYSHVHNCMTRFRVTIKNKAKVDLEAIKKLPIVKGINWNGNELQIIIGGEVYKVVDEFKKLKNQTVTENTKKNDFNSVTKPKLFKRICQAMIGIMAPIIPVVMTIGIVAALQSILTQTGILQSQTWNPTLEKNVDIDMTNLHLFNLWSGIFFIAAKVLLNLIGVFFIYNTTKYFKGNTILAIAVGITLVSRGFFPVGVMTDIADAGFGDFISSQGKTGWLLFKLGTFPIIIGGYEGAIIPFIVAGVTLTYLDKWIKKWMPSVIDVIFRPTLIYILTIFAIWFLLGPFFGLIEFGISQAIIWIGAIPFGIGVMIFAFLWQPLVVTGVHIPIAVAIVLPMTGQNPVPSPLYAGIFCATFGQLGAALAIGWRTRNANLRNATIAAVTAGVFGITEPIIYGVTLPKGRPFLFGCLAAAIAGLLSGILGLQVIVPNLQGIFGITGMDGGAKGILLTLLTWFVAISTAFTFTSFLYQERKNEVSLVNKGLSSLAKLIYGKPTKEQKILINDKFKMNVNELKSFKKDFHFLEVYYGKLSKFEQKLQKIEAIKTKNHEKIYKQLLKWQQKLRKKPNESLLVKFNNLNDKYSSYDLESKKEPIKKTLASFMIDNEKQVNTIIANQNQWLTTINNKVNAYNNKKDNENYLKNITNLFFNAINTVEIAFGKKEAK